MEFCNGILPLAVEKCNAQALSVHNLKLRFPVESNDCVCLRMSPDGDVHVVFTVCYLDGDRPKERLVCVELNPGPKKGKAPAKRVAERVAHALSVGAAGHNTRARRRRASQATTLHGQGILPNLTVEYFKSLVNPFDFPGVYLGWGCMVPSTIITAYLRRTGTAATDGSYACALLPCVAAGMIEANGGAAVSFATSASLNNLSNQAAVTANASEGRVVSAGIRAYPDIALTAVPGAVYTGAVVCTDYTNFAALTPNDLVALPTSHMSVGTKGGSAAGRPVDPSSFTFVQQSVDANGYQAAANAGLDIPFSVPYVCFTGVGNGVSIFTESVLNIETTTKVAHSGTSVIPGGGNSNNTGRSLSDVWASFEQMWGHVKSVLPPPGRMDEAAAATDSTLLSSILSGVGRMAISGAKTIISKRVGGSNIGSLLSMQRGSGMNGRGYRLSDY